jgi:hypothetical protein
MKRESKTRKMLANSICREKFRAWRKNAENPRSRHGTSVWLLHSCQKNSIRSNNSIQKVKTVLKIIAEDQNNNHS